MKATLKGRQDGVAARGQAERLSQQISILADRLPEMIGHTFGIYEDLTRREIADDVRSIATHQAALRAALAHLEALLNLARRLAEPGRTKPSQDDEILLEHLYSQAAAAAALLAEEPED